MNYNGKSGIHPLIAALIIFMFGCATHIPDTVIGNSQIDTSKFIGIEPFEFNPNAATEVNVATIEDFGKELAENISSELLKNGIRSAIIKQNTPSDKFSYIIRGRILEVHGGSKGQRIWFGFGYGASNVTVRCEIVDAKTNEIIKNLNITKQSNWTYSGNETAVRENLSEVAIEIINNIKVRE